MTLSAIHNETIDQTIANIVVCDIGGYDFVSYSQQKYLVGKNKCVVCDIGGYDFVSYSQRDILYYEIFNVVCDIGGYDFVSYSQQRTYCRIFP